MVCYFVEARTIIRWAERANSECAKISTLRVFLRHLPVLQISDCTKPVWFADLGEVSCALR
jgi:hypothetical protein